MRDAAQAVKYQLMSWSLAADWAFVAGSALLTFGTGAQAWANLAEYRDVLASLPEAYRRAVRGLLFWSLIRLPGVVGAFIAGAAGAASVVAAGELTEILQGREVEGGEDLGRLARLARLTVVWTVLMAGSVLVLTGAVIQLVLGYAA